MIISLLCPAEVSSSVGLPITAECLSVRQVILQCGLNTVSSGGHPGGTACVQDGIPTSYIDAAFVILAHNKSEIWTSLSLRFTQVT